MKKILNEDIEYKRDIIMLRCLSQNLVNKYSMHDRKNFQETWFFNCFPDW